MAAFLVAHLFGIGVAPAVNPLEVQAGLVLGVAAGSLLHLVLALSARWATRGRC